MEKPLESLATSGTGIIIEGKALEELGLNTPSTPESRVKTTIYWLKRLEDTLVELKDDAKEHRETLENYITEGNYPKHEDILEGYVEANYASILNSINDFRDFSLMRKS